MEVSPTTDPGQAGGGTSTTGPAPPMPAAPVPGSGGARRSGLRPRRRPDRPRGSLPLWLRVAAGSLAGLVALLGGLTAFAALTLPSLDGLGHAAGTIRILDRHGALIAEVGHDDRRRTTVPLAAIAPVMRAATIAAEDRSFETEGAVNYGRVLKALVVDVLSRSASEGGSTITQQLAKLAFLSPDRSPLRKVREALLANQLGQRYSKDDILELYLNLIDYGHGTHGVEDAAERYFGVPAAQLDLREASLLAGLPQAPSDNDPLTHPEQAMGRQHYVLRALVETGAVGAADADAVDPLASDPAIRDRNQRALRAALARGRPPAPSPAPHLVDEVVSELTTLGGSRTLDELGSLDVTTSVDLAVQRRAEAAVRDGVGQLRGGGANNGALLMLDPANGSIVALVGSADYQDSAIAGEYDVVTGARRPGSTFKPIVYATAFAEGRLTPASTLDDTAEESARLGGVQDVDRHFTGRLSVRDALLGSRNVPAEQAMLLAGIPPVLDTARNLGITSTLSPDATTAIGASAVRMIDLTGVYAAFANGGRRVMPHAVTAVRDGDGALLYAARGGAGDRVLPQGAVDQLNGILRDYPARWGLHFDRATAGKSGTTDDSVDAWYVAYTDAWVVTSWVGHTDGATTAETPMANVFGIDVGRTITAPFVAGLPASPRAQPAAPPGCSGQDCGRGATGGD